MPTLTDRQRRFLPLAAIPAILLLCGLPWFWFYHSRIEPQHFRISTGQSGGAYHPLAVAIAEIVHKDHPRLEFEAIPGSGSIMSMNRIEAGECEFAILQNGTSAATDRVRAIVALYPEVLHIIVRENSTVKSLRDLVGLRLAVGPRQSGTQQILQPLFRHFGLPDEAFTAVYSDMSEGCSKLLNEEVDAVFVVAGVHAPAIRDVMASGRVRLIGIGEYEGEAGEIHGFQLHYPDIEPYTLPIGTYPSSDYSQLGRPRDPIRTVSVPSVLVCSAEVDEVVVNQITRSIFENRTPLAQKYPIMGQISEPVSATSLAYPLHQGAEAYFRRDEPSFLVNYAEVMAFLLSVVISLWGAVLAFRNWLTLRKKDRIDEYYVRIDELLSRLHGEESIPVSELHAMEQELSLLRQRAVQELVAERLIANESFRIFQTLLSNSQAEVRRQLEKEN